MSIVSGSAAPYLIFDCPTCGVSSEGVLEVTVSWDPVRVFPKRTVGPGMVADDLSAEPRIVVRDRWVATSACRCAFSLRCWRVDVDPGVEGKAPRLLVTRLPGAELGDGQAAAGVDGGHVDQPVGAGENGAVQVDLVAGA